MQHVAEGRRVLDALLEKLADLSKVERPPAMDGKRMTVMLMPTKVPPKPRAKPKTHSPDDAKTERAAALPAKAAEAADTSGEIANQESSPQQREE